MFSRSTGSSFSSVSEAWSKFHVVMVVNLW